MIEIREMRKSDLEAVLDLRLRWLSKNYDVLKTKENVRAWFARYPGNSQAPALVAVTGEEIIGYVLAALMRHPAASGVCAEIDEVYVAESHRRKGLGRRLATLMRELLQSTVDDLNAIRARVDREDESASAFWQALGFEHDVLEFNDYLE